MKLNCTIDGQNYSLNVSQDKPLNRILNELLASFSINSTCKGASCGNCMVIINGNYTLSCLQPAFKLQNADIITYESFSKTKFNQLIEKAYTEIGSRPCYQCYASKTLLISSLVLRKEKEKQISEILSSKQKLLHKTDNTYKSHIEEELKINSCNCMELSHIEQIVKLVCNYRSNENGIHK